MSPNYNHCLHAFAQISQCLWRSACVISSPILTLKNLFQHVIYEESFFCYAICSRFHSWFILHLTFRLWDTL